MTKLGKTETATLTEAAGREGGTLVLTEASKPVTRQRILGHLEQEGLIAIRDGEPIITDAGRRAVGAPPEAKPERSNGKIVPASPDESRDGTRAALLVSLLSKGEGASIAELMAATGWLPHTTRAALTGLRKRGYPVERAGEAGQSRYRIPTPEPVSKPAVRRRRPRQEERAAA